MSAHHELYVEEKPMSNSQLIIKQHLHLVLGIKFIDLNKTSTETHTDAVSFA